MLSNTVSEELILSAIGIGANAIEFHLDLEDKQGFEFSHGHCWTPDSMKRLLNKKKWFGKTYPQNDIGYPVSIQLKDESILTAYYITTEDKITSICTTKWKI